MPHEDCQSDPKSSSSFGEEHCPKCSISELCKSDTSNDVLEHVGVISTRNSSWGHGYYLGIGTWALDILGSITVSPFIDFTAADLYAVFDDGGGTGITQCTGATSTSNSAQKATESSQTGSNTRRIETQNPQKRPCTDERGQDEDGDPEKPKRPKTRRSFGPAQDKKLACPFYKNERTRAKHPRCAGRGFPDVARMKYVPPKAVIISHFADSPPQRTSLPNPLASR